MTIQLKTKAYIDISVGSESGPIQKEKFWISFCTDYSYVESFHIDKIIKEIKNENKK